LVSVASHEPSPGGSRKHAPEAFRRRDEAIDCPAAYAARLRPVKWWKLASALFRFVDVVEIGHGPRSRMSPWLGSVPPTGIAWL